MRPKRGPNVRRTRFKSYRRNSKTPGKPGGVVWSAFRKFRFFRPFRGLNCHLTATASRPHIRKHRLRCQPDHRRRLNEHRAAGWWSSAGALGNGCFKTMSAARSSSHGRGLPRSGALIVRLSERDGLHLGVGQFLAGFHWASGWCIATSRFRTLVSVPFEWRAGSAGTRPCSCDRHPHLCRRGQRYRHGADHVRRG